MLKFFKHILDRQASLLQPSELCEEVHCILVVVCSCILLPEVMNTWLDANPLLPSAFFNFGVSILKICAKVDDIHPSKWFGVTPENSSNSGKLLRLLRLFFDFELTIISKAQSDSLANNNTSNVDSRAAPASSSKIRGLLLIIQKCIRDSEYMPAQEDRPNDTSFTRFLTTENDMEAPHRATKAAKVLGIVLGQYKPMPSLKVISSEEKQATVG